MIDEKAAEDIYRELSSFVKIKRNEPMKKHTTFRLGGPAALWIEVETEQQLGETIKCLRDFPFAILGAGSNVLFSDDGYPGAVIKLKGDFTEMEFSGQQVSAGAGTMLTVLINRALEKNLGGLQILAGIPGTLGGALVINAGTKWGEVGSLVARVKVMDRCGEIYWLDKKDISFSYRYSSLRDYFCLAAELNLSPAAASKIAEQMRQYLLQRAQQQPLSAFNAGSIFKNPPSDFAARLIESCGLKGQNIGGAFVSERHANFIINQGKASARDVRELIELVRQTVRRQTGVELELEIKLLGF